MINNNLKTIFPFSDNPDFRWHRQLNGTCASSLYRLISDGVHLLPILIKTLHKVDHIDWAQIVDEEGAVVYDVPLAVFQIFNLADGSGSFIQCLDLQPLPPNGLPQGHAYTVELSYNSAVVMYSEEFYVPCDFDRENYIVFEWFNTCDILGVLYQKGFLQRWYCEGNIWKGTPTIDEEGFEDGLKNFYPTRQTYLENLTLTELIPPFVVDALVAMQMHDSVTLYSPKNLPATPDYAGILKNIKTSLAWEENGCFALLTMVMQQETDLFSKTGCCNNMQLEAVLTPCDDFVTDGEQITAIVSDYGARVVSYTFPTSDTVGTVYDVTLTDNTNTYQQHIASVTPASTYAGQFTNVINLGFGTNYTLTVKSTCPNGDTFTHSVPVAFRNVVFVNNMNCTGLQYTNFDMLAPAGTIVVAHIALSGYFHWETTDGSHNVTVTGSVQTPAGYTTFGISHYYAYTGQTGQQQVNENSSDMTFTMPASGKISFTTTCNMNNGGTGTLRSGSFVVTSVNGDTSQTNNTNLCFGISSGG